MPRAILYNNRQSAGHKFIREVIAMSLRKVAGALALLAVISVIWGGGQPRCKPGRSPGTAPTGKPLPIPDRTTAILESLAENRGQNPLLRH